MNHKIRVALTLTGTSGYPDDITALLKIAPDKTGRVGDPIASTIRRHQDHGWQIVSSEHTDASLSEHVTNVRERLSEASESIGALSRAWKIELSCRVQAVGSSAPEMYFDAETLGWLNELNASIDIDLYCVGE
jgi:hypothetical protein